MIYVERKTTPFEFLPPASALPTFHDNNSYQLLDYTEFANLSSTVLIMLTDIFSDGNLLITLQHTSYLSYDVKISSVLVDGKLQDFLFVSSWIFLSTANNLVPCQKSTSVHQTHAPSRLQGMKSYVLEIQCGQSCYAFRLVWFLFLKPALNQSLLVIKMTSGQTLVSTILKISSVEA